MKKINSFFSVMLLLICGNAIAQIPACFNFDDSIAGTAAIRENVIDLLRGPGQPFQNWISTSGSPSIISTGQFSNFVAASGTQSLILAACGSNNSEGVAYAGNFQPGRNYRVIYKRRFISTISGNPAIDNFSVILANGLVHNNQGGCSATPSIPTGSQMVSSLTNYRDTIWHSDTLYINGLTSSFTYLWFRLNIAQSLGVASFVVLDDLCIDDITSTCFDFDDSIAGTASIRENVIDLLRGPGQPFEGWISTSGSPSIFSTGQGPGFVAASGNQSLILAACGNSNSEGAAYAAHFQQGKSYRIVFKSRYFTFTQGNPPIDDFLVLLANGLVHNNQGGCSPTIAIPTGSQRVGTYASYSDTIWRSDTIHVSSLTDSFTYVWFRVNIAQGLGNASYVVLDDVCISEETQTSINEADQTSDMMLYPDPAVNSITVANIKGNATLYDLRIMNMNGQQIAATVLSHDADKMHIDVSHLPIGNYALLMTNGQGTQVKRFAIAR